MEPFLKWAGGKRWLTRINEPFQPAHYNNYIEPFLGGGSVFFYLSPEVGVLNDRNKELMNMYRVLRDQPLALKELIKWHQAQHSDEHYYKLRSREPKSKLERAARFLYLNRACWNGLYRVNKLGQFNVPKGTKNTVFFEKDDYEGAANLLKKVKLCSTDFEKIIDLANEGDFVFVDPPYTVKHNRNNFARYNERIFSWEDQERLAESVKRAYERGCKVAVTNADHASIRKLYGFTQYRSIARASVIAGDPSKRAKITEALFTCNYRFKIAGNDAQQSHLSQKRIN
jgi:DNA adenine methylase